MFGEPHFLSVAVEYYLPYAVVVAKANSIVVVEAATAIAIEVEQMATAWDKVAEDTSSEAKDTHPLVEDTCLPIEDNRPTVALAEVHNRKQDLALDTQQEETGNIAEEAIVPANTNLEEEPKSCFVEVDNPQTVDTIAEEERF
jgi:hypothetical protein